MPRRGLRLERHAKWLWVGAQLVGRGHGQALAVVHTLEVDWTLGGREEHAPAHALRARPIVAPVACRLHVVSRNDD